MKQKSLNNGQRDKAFIGAAIGAVTSIAGGLIGGAAKRRKQRKAEEKVMKEMQTEQNEEDTLQAAQALSSSYADQEYADEFTKKVTLRGGGKVTADSFGDRFTQMPTRRSRSNKGRAKAEFGKDDIANIINAVGTAASGTINSIYQNNPNDSGRIDFSAVGAADRTAENKRIADEAQAIREGSFDTNPMNDDTTAGRRAIQSSTARMGTKRPKAFLGDAIGGASSGIGSLISGLMDKPTVDRSQIKTNSVTTAASAPKTGIVTPEYLNEDEDVPPVDAVYGDRLAGARMGKRMRRKVRK